MSKNRSWPVALSAIFAGIVIAIVQNKVIPCLSALQEAFSISMSAAGWLSSLFCIMSIIVSFPAAIITNRLGVKKTCLYSLLFAAAGSLLGICSRSVFLLMLSRIMEGVGAGLISIAVPSVISMWFPPEKRGLPTGLWSSWQYVAQALCFFFGVSLTDRYGWRGMWYAGLIALAAGIVLCVLIVRAPAPGEGYVDAEEQPNVSILSGLKSRHVWTASFSMFFFCFACFGFVTWAAQCWSETLGLTLDAANRYVSLFAIISLPIVVLAGVLMDRVDHRRFAACVCFGYIFAVCAAFVLPSARWVLIFVIVYPFFEGAVSTALWTIIPLTAEDGSGVSIAVALFTLTSNVGMLVGPPIIGAVADAFGWKACVVPLAIAMAIGTLMIAVTKEHQ